MLGETIQDGTTETKLELLIQELKSMDKIILGYDFTENSESALNMALILAEKGNCALEIVWVDDTLDDTVQIAKETIQSG